MKFGNVLNELYVNPDKVFRSNNTKTKVFLKNNYLRYKHTNGISGVPNLPGAWFDSDWEEYKEYPLVDNWNFYEQCIEDGEIVDVRKLKQKLLEDIEKLRPEPLPRDFIKPMKEIINKRFGF